MVNYLPHSTIINSITLYHVSFKDIETELLTHSNTITPFDAPGKQSFRKNSVGKGEITHNEQFLLFPQCFLPI